MTGKLVVKALVGIAAVLASVLAGIATAAPAAACTGDDCGYAFLDFNIGPFTAHVYGETLMVQAKMSDGSDSCSFLLTCDYPTGRVDFYEEGAGWPIASGELHRSGACGSEGFCDTSVTQILQTTVIHAGEPAILAHYIPGGATPFFADDKVHKVPIAPAPSAIALSQSSSASSYGETVTFSATVTPLDPARIDTAHGAHLPTGWVDFAADGVNLGAALIDGNQVATLTTNAVRRATPAFVSARYRGDGDYTAAARDILHDVGPASVTAALTQSASTTVYGEPFSLTATVTPLTSAAQAPTGAVTFVDNATNFDSANLAGGVPDIATTSTSSLGAGVHSLAASYGGDSNFSWANSPVISHTVNKANTVTTIAATTPNPTNVGDEVTLSASVAVTAPGAGAPTGAVQFLDGVVAVGTPASLSGNNATLRTRSLGGGSHNLIAKYLGDSNYNASTSTPASHSVRCDVVVTTVTGNYDVSPTGTTCITNGNVGGSVTVPGGALLSITNSTIRGGLVSSSGARALLICGSSIGSVTISNTTGPLIMGSPYVDGCSGNTLRGNVGLQSNRAGVRFDGNQAGAGVQVTGTAGATYIGGNRVTGWLQCTGNSPAAANGDHPNTAGGRTGECAAPTF